MESGQKPRLGVAIFGLGRAGQIHMKNVVQNYTLRLLYGVDLRVEHGKSLIHQFNQEQCQVLSPSEKDVVFNDPCVDFVMVCTPSFQHEEIVLAAVKAGKAVFCEKPVALNQAAIENCYKAADRAKVPLFCSFNRRFDPSIRKMFNSRQQVGQVQLMKSCSRDGSFASLEYFKVSGGIFHDCLVHDIDLVCWMLGEYPKQVFASGHAFHEELKSMGDVDTVAVVMKFNSGALAIIDASREAVYGHDQRLELFGSKGMLLNQNQRPNNMVREGVDGVTSGRMYESFHDRFENSYIKALDHLCSVVRGEQQAEVSMETVLNVSKIADALEKSIKTSQQVDVAY